MTILFCPGCEVLFLEGGREIIGLIQQATSGYYQIILLKTNKPFKEVYQMLLDDCVHISLEVKLTD